MCPSLSAIVTPADGWTGALLSLVQDDFLMGREREDGEIYLAGGLIVFPGTYLRPAFTLPVEAQRWLLLTLAVTLGTYLLSETINKPLATLHKPVPHFNEKLLVSVERTLKRFKPDQPFERSSWMIVDDRNLFWRVSSSYMRFSDAYLMHVCVHLRRRQTVAIPHTTPM